MYCNNCSTCKLNKSYVEKAVPILKHPEVSQVFESVHVDLIGPLTPTESGHKYILTVIDAFSRYGICIPLINKSMQSVARAFVDNVLTKFGICNIFSGRGLEFTGSDFKKSVKDLGFSQRFTTSFNPQSNGLGERYNTSITEILRCLTYEQPNNWDKSLQLATLAYNTSYCQAIQETPYYIFFLRDPVLPIADLLKANSVDLNIKTYPQEMLQSAARAFRLCKQFSEKKINKRNIKAIMNREF